MSLPGPLKNESAPSAPSSSSSPAPPSRTSFPSPPRSRSSPWPPVIVSLPASPQITSSPGVPVNSSGPVVPAIVQEPPAAPGSARIGVARITTVNSTIVERSKDPLLVVVSATSHAARGSLGIQGPVHPVGIGRWTVARPGQLTGAGQDLVYHRRRELAREGVLLAGMETAEHDVGPDDRLRPVPEPRFRPRDPALRGERAEDAVPRERAETEHDADAIELIQLADQEGEAAIALLGRGPVAGRRAPVHRRHVGPPEPEPVVARDRGRLVREVRPMQRREQDVTAAIAREDAPRAVPAVRGGCEPDDQDPRAGVAETRHGPAPVLLV